MLTVLFTPEADTVDENKIIAQLFSSGLKLLHVRKPLLNKEELKRYVSKIPRDYHKNIVIHSHYELVNDFDLKGVHLPEYDRDKFLNDEKFCGDVLPKAEQLSTSFHSLYSLENYNEKFGYVFLSPIFNSISKLGYNAKFKEAELKKALKDTKYKVIALGGIDVDKLQKVKELKFFGAALFGSIWNSNNPIQKFIEFNKAI